MYIYMYIYIYIYIYATKSNIPTTLVSFLTFSCINRSVGNN